MGTARRLDRLCQEHDAYRWLCGGVPVNYHTLSDFRMAHQEALDPDASGLTEIVATLMDQKLVTLKQVAQDGVRVRASAGGGSFHRRNHLEQCLVEAEEQVRRLAEERDHPDPKVNLREQVAQERAARERMERVEAALRQLPAVQAPTCRDADLSALPRSGSRRNPGVRRLLRPGHPLPRLHRGGKGDEDA